MKDERVNGAVSNIFEIFVQNAGATNGAGLTGLVFNSASLTAYYKNDNASSATAITLANITTIGTFANNGFREVDSTNMPGIYEFDPPNAAFNVASSKSVVFMLKGATNMAPVVFEITLKAVNTQDSVRGGMTALPNANAEASGGLYTRGTGAGQIKQTNNGEIDANATHINNIATTSVTTVNANVGQTQPVNFTGTGGSALVKSDMVDVAGAAVSTSSAQIGVNAVNIGGTAQTGRDLGASVLLSSGTGTGQLDFTSGVVKASLAQILGTAFTEGAAGRIAAAFKQFFNIASPAATMDHLILVDTATALTTNNDKTGYSLTQTFPTNFSSLSIDGSGRVDIAKWVGVAPNALVSGKVDSATVIRGNTAAGGAAGSITLDGSASAVNDFYKGDWILITSGTGVGQVRGCSAYNGSTKVATVVPNWATTPDNTSVFIVIPAAAIDLVNTVTTLTNAPSDSSGTTTLLSRLTSTRAGYLDNLSAGAAALESSVQSVLSKLLKYVQLILRKDSAIGTDNATEVTAINADGGSGSGSFLNTTDSQEAIRDKETDIETDTQDIQTRLPAALTAGGKIKASMDEILAVGQSATDLKDFADDGYDPSTNKVQGVVLTDTATNLTNAPTNGDLTTAMKASVNAEVDTALADYDGPTHAELVSEINDVQSDIAALPTAAENADAVWEEPIGDHSGTSGSTAEALGAAGAAGDPWTTLLPGSYGAGSAGKIVGDNINATIGSRATQTSVDAIDDFVDTEVAAIKTQTDKLNFTGTDVKATLDGETVTVGTNNDKTGYALSSAGIQAIWDALTSALTTVGSIGKRLADDINATISSRSSHTAADVWAVGTRTLTSFGTLVADTATAVWGAATRILTAGTNIVLAKGTGVTGFNDVSAAQVKTEADQALADYDGPTRAEATSDKNQILARLLSSGAVAKLEESAGTIVLGTADDAGFSPTTTEFEASDITEATTDHYNGRIIIFTSGALQNQATSISGYSLQGGRGHFVVVALTEPPADGDTFVIV